MLGLFYGDLHPLTITAAKHALRHLFPFSIQHFGIGMAKIFILKCVKCYTSVEGRFGVEEGGKDGGVPALMSLGNAAGGSLCGKGHIL